MKKGKIIALVLFCTALFFSTSSCTVLVPVNNGQHKGWFKNPRNPHNPKHRQTIKPFKSRGAHYVIITEDQNNGKKKGKKYGKNKKK